MTGSDWVPIHLPSNTPRQFYEGGAAIAAFRGIGRPTPFHPEDWVGSTITLFGTEKGLARLPEGTFVKDAIEADPVAYLGPDHVAAYGANPAVLIKLLDAGQRLPVHCHPDRQFARAHLGCAFGKTEAWVVIGVTSKAPTVYLGFSRDIGEHELEAAVVWQDSAALLGSLNALTVVPGDTVLVPAGVPHVIGEGVFVVELQEPTDFSVMLEWKGFDLEDRAESQLGLKQAAALSCVDRSAWSADRLDSLLTHGADAPPGTVRSLLPSEADPFFRAEEYVGGPEPVSMDRGFSLLVVTDGSGQLHTEAGRTVDVRRGDTVLVPYAAGAITLTGTCRIIRCLPPHPRLADTISGLSEGRATS